MTKIIGKPRVSKVSKTIVDCNFITVTSEIETKEVVETETSITSEVTWKGAKIPMQLWFQIVSFMRDSYDKNKSEAQMRLFYNTVTDKWAAWAFPQEAQGMTVSEIEDDPQKDIDHKQFGDDWTEMGSIHHHCTGGAFQSGTDHKDEINRDGLHITIGHITKAEVDIDARFCVAKNMISNLDPVYFIEGIESNLAEDFAYQLRELLVYNPKKATYPKQWLDNVKKKQYTTSKWTGANCGKKTTTALLGTKLENTQELIEDAETSSYKNPMTYINSKTSNYLNRLYGFQNHQDARAAVEEELEAQKDKWFEEVLSYIVMKTGEFDMKKLEAKEIMAEEGVDEQEFIEWFKTTMK